MHKVLKIDFFIAKIKICQKNNYMITNVDSFRVLNFISIFLKIKIQYRVTAFKSMKGKHCLFKNCAYLSYCHLFYRATQAVWIMIARFHGYSGTVLATVNCTFCYISFFAKVQPPHTQTRIIIHEFVI